MSNYIYQYYQKIQDGSIIVGKWILLWYEYIIKGLGSGLFYFDAKKANKAIKFIETFCRHHEGALAPQLIKLELWQKAFLSVVFGIVDEAGNRQFREIVCIIARKNGKTLFAAGIAEYCTFLDGEYGARIYFAAPKLEQAALCYDAYFQMIDKDPELSIMAKKRRSDIYIAESNSSARPLAFSAKKSDGLNISLCVADEIASWPGEQGLKFYEVIKSSFGARRQPLLLSISTAGYINEGIYDELMKRCTRFLMGDSKEKRIAPFLYMIDDVSKWNDINELQKSNPNLGISVSVDYLLEEIAIAEGSLSKKAEFLTKYCNIKQNSSQAWLAAQDVERLSGAALSLEDFRDCYCVGGIDLSRTTDLTACVIVIEKSGKLYVFARFFLPEEKIQEATEIDGLPYSAYIQRGILTASGDNLVDYHDCFNWFVKLVEEYHIYPLKIGYDRYSAQYLVQEMSQYGFHMDDVFQGYNLTPVICETEGLVKDGMFCIGDNDLLKVHLLDTALKTDAVSGRSKPIKINPTSHIDGAAALLDAMTVRQKYYAEIGEQLKNGG
ncbi:terminase large subunit [Christensenella massiliensis]|uniref:Terminase large subunit n=1 Tax=Christensenella massiliensis TaxID=1805714 RepID=A0AAU8AB05_9FIRM